MYLSGSLVVLADELESVREHLVLLGGRVRAVNSDPGYVVVGRVQGLSGVGDLVLPVVSLLADQAGVDVASRLVELLEAGVLDLRPGLRGGDVLLKADEDLSSERVRDQPKK